MSKPVECPICHGTGKTTKYPIDADNSEVTCHGCDGKGWVEVSEDPAPYYSPIYPDIGTASNYNMPWYNRTAVKFSNPWRYRRYDD